MREQIQKALGLPDEDFSSHESDLYVKYSPELKRMAKKTL